MAQYVGAFRIDLEDPMYLCRYIDDNIKLLKMKALVMVQEHFMMCRVNLGLKDPVTIDEYGASFTLSSISDEGREVLPNGENEAPLSFCFLPNLLKKTRLGTFPDGTHDETYFVNFRLHQVHPNLRIQPLGETNKRKSSERRTSTNDSKWNPPRSSTATSIGPPPIKIPTHFDPWSRDQECPDIIDGPKFPDGL